MTIAAIATLNARLLPMDRGERYEDPLMDALNGRAFYEVVGGGSQLLLGSNEIEYCCIDIDIHHLDQAIPLITDTLNEVAVGQASPAFLKLQTKIVFQSSIESRNKSYSCISLAGKKYSAAKG